MVIIIAIENQVINLEASEELTNKSVELNIQNIGLIDLVITDKSNNKSVDNYLAIDEVKIY